MGSLGIKHFWVIIYVGLSLFLMKLPLLNQGPKRLSSKIIVSTSWNLEGIVSLVYQGSPTGVNRCWLSLSRKSPTTLRNNRKWILGQSKFSTICDFLTWRQEYTVHKAPDSQQKYSLGNIWSSRARTVQNACFPDTDKDNTTHLVVCVFSSLMLVSRLVQLLFFIDHIHVSLLKKKQEPKNKHFKVPPDLVSVYLW